MAITDYTVSITLIDSVVSGSGFITDKNESDFKFKNIDTNEVVAFSEFVNEGNGNYNFSKFDVPLYEDEEDDTYKEYIEARLFINDVQQDSFGIYTLYPENRQPVGSGVIPFRLDRGFPGQDVNAGSDTMFGIYQYDDSVDVDLINIEDKPKALTHVKWTNQRISGSVAALSSSIATEFNDVARLAEDNTFTAYNTFGGALFYSTLPEYFRTYVNGGFIDIASLTIYPLDAVTPLIDFHTSRLISTGDGWFSGKITFDDLHINSGSTQHTDPTPYQPIDREYADTHYQLLTDPFDSNTIIVDQKVKTPISGSLSTTIGAAIQYLTHIIVPTSQSIWNILVRESTGSLGYIEDVTVPDYVNIIGQGLPLIYGQLIRTGGNGITSKLKDLVFFNNDSNDNHQLHSFEINNCVFETRENPTGGQIAMTSCSMSDVKLFGYKTTGGIVSNGANKFYGVLTDNSSSAMWKHATDKFYCLESSVTGSTYVFNY